MKVKKPFLLLFAALTWFVGSFMVLKTGVVAALTEYNFFSMLVSLAVFSAFHIFIFGRLVKRHTLRIMDSEEPKLFFLSFFDLRSWLVMIFMMGMGIALRRLGILPNWWIASVYVGIGSALAVGGIHFALYYIRVLRNGTHQSHRTLS